MCRESQEVGIAADSRFAVDDLHAISQWGDSGGS